MSLDPTECADSQNIIPAIQSHAPHTVIFYLGGLIYGYSINDILNNFDENSDLSLFEFSMLTDELPSRFGYNCYFTSITKLPV